jgi:hypothetical protein
MASKSEEIIFVVFRAGKSESEAVNVRRLSHVRKFLEKSKRWEPLNVVYTRGDRTDSTGQIEFYVGGRPFLIVQAATNKTPCLDCCDGGDEYPQNLLRIRKNKRHHPK